jgi:hypothetical protein
MRVVSVGWGVTQSPYTPVIEMLPWGVVRQVAIFLVKCEHLGNVRGVLLCRKSTHPVSLFDDLCTAKLLVISNSVGNVSYYSLYTRLSLSLSLSLSLYRGA